MSKSRILKFFMQKISTEMAKFGGSQKYYILMKQLFLIMISLMLMTSCKESQNAEESKSESNPTVMQQNLNKYVPVRLTSDLSKLSDKERQMLPILIKGPTK